MDISKEVTIRIINKSNNPLPQYETIGSAGLDLRAFIAEPITLEPLERRMIPTGLYLEIPDGYEAQIRPRSGMALKHGITLINTPGTIDADYRGEIGLLLVNLSNTPYTIHNGDRVAQLVLTSYVRIHWNLTESLTKTERSSGGFGHTGKN